MKRFVIGAALGIALLVPAQAPASTHHYRGTITGAAESKVSFDVVTKNGVSKVKNFLAKDVPGTCNGGGSIITGDIDKAMKLDDQNEFKGADHTVTEESGADYTEKATGKAGQSSASGTWRVNGDVETGVSCDTGKLDWTAERV